MIVTPILKPIKTPQFGKMPMIKRLWFDGDLPTVKTGIYGELLTKDNISIEHLKPKAKGGTSELGNLAFADVMINNRRGAQPLRIFVTPEKADNYLDQFKGVIVRQFNGDTYISAVKKTLKKLDISV